MKACPDFPARAVLPTLKPSTAAAECWPPAPQGSEGTVVPLQVTPAPRPRVRPAPVHVGPQVLGGIVVDHQLHALHVDAAGHGVSADETGEIQGAVGPVRG